MLCVLRAQLILESALHTGTRCVLQLIVLMLYYHKLLMRQFQNMDRLKYQKLQQLENTRYGTFVTLPAPLDKMSHIYVVWF